MGPFIKKISVLVNCVILATLWQGYVAANVKVTPINQRLDISYLPKKDFPSAAEKNELKNCSSKLFYYGIGVPVDYAKARKCAFVENEGGYGDVFAGARIIVMIYANGLGVKRNLDYALKLMHQIDKADHSENNIDQKALIEHLETLKANPENKLFDLCDNANTTFMINFCAAKEHTINKAKQEAEIKSISVKWTPQQLIAFSKLRKTADDFFKSRVDNEVDTSGTVRGFLQINEQDSLEKDFKSEIDGFEAGKLPTYSTKEFEKSDEKLNKIYSNVLKESEKGDWGTVVKSGIIQTERAWLRYRDVWVEFGSIRYPSVSKDSWKAFFTKERTKQLKDYSPVTLNE